MSLLIFYLFLGVAAFLIVIMSLIAIYITFSREVMILSTVAENSNESWYDYLQEPVHIIDICDNDDLEELINHKDENSTNQENVLNQEYKQRSLASIINFGVKSNFSWSTRLFDYLRARYDNNLIQLPS